MSDSDSDATLAATVALKPGAPAAGTQPPGGADPAAPEAPVEAPSADSGRGGPAAEPERDAAEYAGLVVDGRYRLERPLAQGGMGSVWLATQVNLNRRVAIKLMDNPDPELVERFRREAVALAEVSHPAIVEIYDFSLLDTPTGARGCLVMAFIDGKDLGDYLEEQPDLTLEAREVRILMLPVVSALVELHANGIIHRDIKPDNIVRFVRADGRPGVKLVDFGIARRQVDAGMTASGYVLGTPPYLPPETMLGERHTPLSDVYALGATMFELLTGEPPYGSDSVGEIMQRALNQDPVFPPSLQGTAIAALIEQMLAKVPSRRPDAMQVLQALEQMREPLAPAGGDAPAGGLPQDRSTRPMAPVPSRPPSVTDAPVPAAAPPPSAPGTAPQQPNGAPGVPAILGAHPAIPDAPPTSAAAAGPGTSPGAQASPSPTARRLPVGLLVAVSLAAAGMGALLTFLVLR